MFEITDGASDSRSPAFLNDRKVAIWVNTRMAVSLSIQRSFSRKLTVCF